MILLALVTLIAAVSATQIVVNQRQQQQQLPVHKPTVGAPSTCQICQAVVMGAHLYAEFEGLNSTQLQQQLSQVCAFLPMSYQAECAVMVTSFGALECQCITTPTAKFNATACCADVALCSSFEAVAPVAPAVPKLQAPSQCAVCESVATTANIIAQYEGWNATTLWGKLGLVCGLVPSQFQMECQTLVMTFGQVECQCITDPKFNAQECCYDVGVCPQPPLPAPVVRAPTAVNANYCSACKAVATAGHYIAELASLNGTQLDQELARVCTYVPQEYASECQDVISVGGQKIADCVADDKAFDAQTCCYYASLCAPSKLAVATKQI